MVEPLAVLLLPQRLEEFGLAAHARELLEIPRVVAVEPARVPLRGVVGELLTARQARRLRFPGEPRVMVLYHPRQYPLVRALRLRHGDAELWYFRLPDGPLEGEEDRRDPELSALDELAVEASTRTLVPDEVKALRQRLLELEIISSRPFVPGARVERRRTRG